MAPAEPRALAGRTRKHRHAGRGRALWSKRKRKPQGGSGRAPGRPAAAPGEAHEARARAPSIRELAEMMWRTDYRPILLGELAEAPSLAEGSSALMAEALSASTYAKHLYRTNASAWEEYSRKQAVRIRDMTATLRRSASTHDTPFSVAARSIYWLARGRSTKTWLDGSRSRQVVSKPTALKLLGLMTKYSPPPAFEVDDAVQVFSFDQNYLLKGCKGKKGSDRGSMKMKVRAIPLDQPRAAHRPSAARSHAAWTVHPRGRYSNLRPID